MKQSFDFPKRENGNNHLECSCFYKKAGHNWYNGAMEQAGFFISFTAGEKVKNEGYSTFKHDMFGGFKIKVAEGARDNKKKCAKLIELVTPEIALLAFNGETAAVYKALKQATDPNFKPAPAQEAQTA